MEHDPVTAEDVLSFRDAAIVCARSMGSFLARYSQPVADGLPLEDLTVLIQGAADDIRDTQDCIQEWDRCTKTQLMQAIVLANTDPDPQSVFDGYYFSTHHELARAAAEMVYVTLLILTQDIPDSEPDHTRLPTLFRAELAEFHQQYSDFTPNRIVRAITVEAATALEYLRSFAGRSDLAPPTKLRTDSIATQSPVHNTDPEIEARNRFVYEQSLTDKPWNSIRKQIAAMPFKGRIIGTVGGIRRIALAYARTHQLPPPPTRKPGRRPE